MAKQKAYEQHLARRIEGERERYRRGWDDLICKMTADLGEGRILDCQSESPRLQRFGRSGDLEKFFQGFLRSSDDDRQDLRKLLRKGGLAKAFERGEEELSYVLRLDYGHKGMALHVKVEIRLLYDPEEERVQLFFYVSNYSYQFISEMGLRALEERQNHQFVCINVATGAYVIFPDRTAAVFHFQDSFNDAVMGLEDQIVAYGEEVCSQIALSHVCHELDRKGSYSIAFSQQREGKIVQRLFQYSYLDDDHRFILGAALDISRMIGTDVEGMPVLEEGMKRYLASPRDIRQQELRRAGQLNQLLGMKKQEEQDFGGRRVLLVEAHAINAQVAREMLEKRGFAVDVAVDEEKAVDRFRGAEADSYACIFLSVNEESLDGYETARRIRATRRRDAKKIPMIAMGARAEEDAERGKEVGIKAYLTKPLSPHRLGEVLDKYVKASGAKKR